MSPTDTNTPLHLCEGRKLGGHSIKGIAEHFNRDPVVISQGIKRVEQKFREDKVFTNKLITFQKVLAENKKRIFIYA
jgi:aminoglycoside N3'-acetyltransferase